MNAAIYPDKSHTARNTLEIPDMRNRSSELDMSHALTANLLLCNLYTATVADDAFVADSFVFTASTFEIFYRSENPFAEKTVALGFVGSVVDCFGFEHFAP